jgi:uncharacterized membrane protein YdfJ with MMPL/SSD domain
MRWQWIAIAAVVGAIAALSFLYPSRNQPKNDISVMPDDEEKVIYDDGASFDE